MHLSYVKSLNLDKWEPEQLMLFEASGGNQRARTYFMQHGISDLNGQDKYKSRAAQSYKDTLRREVRAVLDSEAAEAAKRASFCLTPSWWSR